MEVHLIVAVDRHGVIGKDGDLPWRLPADLAHFKRVTMGHPLVMGRRTHESIGRALPGRLNIVLSRDPDYAPAEGCVLARDPDEAVRRAEQDGGQVLMVIGGEAIYDAFMTHAACIHLTRVETTVDGGDARFPPLDEDLWEETHRVERAADDANAHGLSFLTLKRRRSE